MTENGPPERQTIWKEVAGQLSDHVELASLELRYETERVTKRLVCAACILVLVLTGFIVLQVALIGGLMKLGLPLSLSALIFGALYFVIAFVIYRLARRDKRVGPPFASTQRELQETIHWIQKILS